MEAPKQLADLFALKYFNRSSCEFTPVGDNGVRITLRRFSEDLILRLEKDMFTVELGSLCAAATTIEDVVAAVRAYD